MTKVALISGANQGLGHALVQVLAENMDVGDVVYLTARSEERGRAALAEIKDVKAEVRFAQLDVTNAASITAIADMLKSEHGGVDLVVSNAAARMVKEKSQAEQVRDFIAVNNHGSRALYGALRSLLKPKAKYLMIASAFGQLSNLPETLHGYFDTDTMSLDDVEASMDHFVAVYEAGSAVEAGWPEWINVPSKIGQVATARVATRDLTQDRPNDDILIAAICPGLMDTAASRPWFDDMSEALSTVQAAKPIVDLLLAEDGYDDAKGQLLQFGKVLPWT